MDLSAVPFEPYYRDEHCVIYNQDCRKVLPFLPKFDLGIHDPPYGIGADKMTLGNGKRKIHRGDEDWDACAPSRAQIETLVDSASATIIWGGNYFWMPPTRCVLVWDKGTGDNDYADCELAWTNFDMVVKKHFQSWVGANAKDSMSVRVHPTQKPLALIRWCLSLCPDAKTVVDCYAGSLTTAVAAKLENRFAVCVEKSEAYCEKGVKRLEQGVLF